MATEALPDRYEVNRRGTPDPSNARYFVLDYANDFSARVALRMLVRGYRLVGRSAAANELETALNASDHDFGEMLRAQNASRMEAAKKSTTKARATGRKSVPMS